MEKVQDIGSDACALRPERVDEHGNRIIAPEHMAGLTVLFKGRHCLLDIHPEARMGAVTIEFRGSNASCRIGRGGASALNALIRLGEDCQIRIGDGLTATARCFVAASEGAVIGIGNDCMFATDVQLRTDDAHPIFDIHTGLRINPSADISIGDHVWLGYGVRCLGGARVGEGSVIGMSSIVTGPIPNNCVAVGQPARVVRCDIAWERPHLSMDQPPYKPDASMITRSAYWNPTHD